MQIYDISIAANSSRRLDAPGTYFYYYAGSAGGADSTITLQGVSSGLRIVLKPGQSMRLQQGAAVETSWMIGNYANAATIIGTVMVGRGEIQDNRITGSVEVIDGGKNRTLANAAFSYPNSANAVAANYASTALWNPVGSGKNAIIERISLSSSVNGFLRWGFLNATTGLTSISAATSKKSSGISSSCTLYNGNLASVPAGWTPLGQYQCLANAVIQYDLHEPIIISPGNGLGICSSNVNTDIYSNFEFFEESV